MSSYSSLFSAGWRAVSDESTRRSQPPPPPIQRRRVTDSFLTANPHVHPGSPARRARLLSSHGGTHKLRSSSSFASSPLAGIKTPIKTAQLAAEMQSLMISPSRRKIGRMATLPEHPTGLDGAPMKARPLTRARRGPPLPAPRTPPSAPLPSLPVSQRPFSLSSRHKPLSQLPTFNLNPATPVSRAQALPQPHRLTIPHPEDDVFGPSLSTSTPLSMSSILPTPLLYTSPEEDDALMVETPLLDSSPVKPWGSPRLPF